MPKALRYGGLSAHYVRLIRDFLPRLSGPDSDWSAYQVWLALAMNATSHDNAPVSLKAIDADTARVSMQTVNALQAALAVLKRKRVSRRCLLGSPSAALAVVGITAPRADA
jgi:hypothetical protein